MTAAPSSHTVRRQFGRLELALHQRLLHFEVQVVSLLQVSWVHVRAGGETQRHKYERHRQTATNRRVLRYLQQVLHALGVEDDLKSHNQATLAEGCARDFVADTVEGVPVELENLVSHAEACVLRRHTVLHHPLDKGAPPLGRAKVGTGHVTEKSRSVRRTRARPCPGDASAVSTARWGANHSPAVAGDDKAPICGQALAAQNDKARLEHSVLLEPGRQKGRIVLVQGRLRKLCKGLQDSSEGGRGCGWQWKRIRCKRDAPPEKDTLATHSHTHTHPATNGSFPPQLSHL